MFGMVLGGGGARGAYEVGAWCAASELGIEVGAVCGTSIGSINAAAFAQGDWERADRLWRSITAEDVLDMSKFTDKNLWSVKNIRAVLEEFRTNKGLSMKPLEDLLHSIIDEEKLRRSPVEFGLVTYSLSDSAELELFKEDIPQGRLIEYLMASACLPGIKTRVIDEKAFVDGCVVDNKPVGMLVKRGFRDILSIDVGGIGLVKSIVPKGINVIEVKCAAPQIGVLDFDKEKIAVSISGGYLDTKRALGAVCGTKYAIRSSDYNRALRKTSREMLDGLETAAAIFGCDLMREYSVISLARSMIREYKRILKHNRSVGIDKLLNAKDSNSSIILAKTAEAVLAGNADFLGTRVVSMMFKGFLRAVNAILYYSDKV